MAEKVHCTNEKCGKDFIYDIESAQGATKAIKIEDSKDLGESKGLFSGKKLKPRNTQLTCPYCNREDFYKVMSL